MAEAMELDAANFRRNSVGTLTGWQLLAGQVTNAGEDTADNSKQNDQVSTSKAAGRRGHIRAGSSCSSMSDDSDMGPAHTAMVTPRPHQWLYKEYKIQDEIGSGGFGRVCRARRLTDGKVVVVKEIKTTSLSQKQKAATMDEVEVLAKFNHPNIVKYHDCFMDDVYINIVMEYCNAGDLAGLIKSKGGLHMPENEVMSLFVQICLALVYVHAAGVLHRDLKSSNVLITSSPNFNGMPLLKLGDFGVAKISGPESSMASTIVGTPQYLSPEMCDNKPYGKKSDVWALGCILYELCSLQKAFDLGNGGISGIILKIMRGTYTPIPATYSDDMKALVGSMLQTNPAARPSVLEILETPYVRQHLQLYLDWARNNPEAHPEILLATLGEFKRGASGGLATVSWRSNSPRASNSPTQPNPCDAAPATAASSSISSAALAMGGGSGSSNISSHDVAAIAATAGAGRAASPRAQSADASASTDRMTSAPSAELPYAAMAQQPQPPRQRMSVDISRKAAEPPPGSLSGWLPGENSLSQRQQQQQMVIAQAAVKTQPAQQQQSGSNPSSGTLPPQQQQQALQHAPGGSSGSSDRDTCPATLWSDVSGAPPADAASGNGNNGKHSATIMQEQMEGLRRLRGLKARMNVQCAWAESSWGCSSHLYTPDRSKEPTHMLATLMSIDSVTTMSAML